MPNDSVLLMRRISAVWAVQILSIGLQTIYLAVSSRAVDAADFGAYAAAISVLAVGGMVANAGLTNASARSANVTTAARRALVTAGLLLSLAATTVVAAGAPVWAGLWGQSQASEAIRLLSFSLPWATWSGILGGFLRRDSRIAAYSYATVSAIVAGLILGVLAVTSWRSAEALTVMPITVPLVSTAVMAMFLGRQALPSTRLGGIRQDVGFGAKSSAVWVIALLSNTLPVIALGRVLGAATLGEWNRAQTLARLPWDTSVRSVTTVTFPMFRSPTHGARASIDRWTSAISTAGLFAVPVALVPLPALPSAVEILLGQQWVETQHMIGWLWVAAAISGMSFLLSSALESAGYFAGIVRAQLAALVVVLIGLVALLTSQSWLALAPALVASSAVAHTVQIRSASAHGLLNAHTVVRWYVLALTAGLGMLLLTWALCALSSVPVVRLAVATTVVVLYVTILAVLRRRLWPLRQLLVHPVDT